MSYSQWRSHRASWVSRRHTGTCWCTCGSGRRLSTWSRTPCAARISTPPSPLAFYFRSEGGRRKNTTRTRETDERKWHRSSQHGEIDFERDGHRPSLWPRPHSPAIRRTPGHYSGCPYVSGETGGRGGGGRLTHSSKHAFHLCQHGVKWITGWAKIVIKMKQTWHVDEIIIDKILSSYLLILTNIINISYR